MTRHLPSMQALRAFDTASRHLSFQQAAAGLNLTAFAISRQIRALEALLGTQLFHRNHRHVRLTRAGQAFLHDITAPLGQIDAAVARFQGSSGGRAVSIQAYPPFAIRCCMASRVHKTGHAGSGPRGSRESMPPGGCGSTA